VIAILSLCHGATPPFDANVIRRAMQSSGDALVGDPMRVALNRHPVSEQADNAWRTDKI
jgi:SspJ family small acid-soluble spore protein